jgi:hypothetical protein
VEYRVNIAAEVIIAYDELEGMDITMAEGSLK